MATSIWRLHLQTALMNHPNSVGLAVPDIENTGGIDEHSVPRRPRAVDCSRDDVESGGRRVRPLFSGLSALRPFNAIQELTNDFYIPCCFCSVARVSAILEHHYLCTRDAVLEIGYRLWDGFVVTARDEKNR
jgi:hypothetical protein